MEAQVTVIIPTYNRPHLIGRAIKSVLSQTYQDFELIVIDSSPDQKTGEVVNNFRDGRIKYVHNKEKTGPAAARNQGVKNSHPSSQYVAFLDDDDEFLPHFLEKTIALLETKGDLSMVTSYLALKTRDGRHIAESHGATDFWEQGVSCGCAIRKKIFTEEHFWYDERLKIMEDPDLGLRVLKSHAWERIPEVLWVYYVYPEANDNTLSSIPSVESIELFSSKNYAIFTGIGKKALSFFYFRNGKLFSKAGDIKSARSNILKAFITYPTPNYFMHYLLSFADEISPGFSRSRRLRIWKQKILGKYRSNMDYNISHKKQIGWIEISQKKYGGVVYNEQARNALASFFDMDLVLREPKYFNKFRYLKIPESLFGLLKLEGRKDLWVRDFYSTLTMPFDRTSGKNLTVIHHDDFSGFPIIARPFFAVAQQIFYRNLKKSDGIVTVSNYWEKYFLAKGYKNVYKIYNGFDISDFDISREEISDFKNKHNLNDKPIIYLGNCQKAKGVVESYIALKDLDAYLVTSGGRQIDIPTLHLELGYRDYLKLLKASSLVVTMSKFKEGWCRTAHEAMLCRTPVIGSGRGGMRELLEGGGQVICENFKNVRKEVENLLKDDDARIKMGEAGYGFAKDFTQERFNLSWQDLINKILA